MALSVEASWLWNNLHDPVTLGFLEVAENDFICDSIWLVLFFFQASSNFKLWILICGFYVFFLKYIDSKKVTNKLQKILGYITLGLQGILVQK